MRKIDKFLVVFCLVMAFTGTAIAANSNDEVVATQKAGAEVCFPFKSWGPASIDKVPCDVLSRPQEDGSGHLELGTLSNGIAGCTIPNPAEEPKHFVIHCTKY